MRTFSRTARITSSAACVGRFEHQGVSRDAVLARWSLQVVKPNAMKTGGLIGKGMKFASPLGPSGWATRNSGTGSTVLDVNWDSRERMDYYVHYSVPSTWTVVEHVSDNSVAIQSKPPVGDSPGAEGPTVHGFSLNCFAYKQKVKEPDCEKLLSLFLRRFDASVSNSLAVLSKASGRGNGAICGTAKPEQDISEVLANRLECAVAEVTFTPAVGEPLAHGLCRAFYNSNRRFHYVVVVAVPEDEFTLSKDLLTHALLAVVESRVEAAPKGT
ncbi:hypothetical protein, conserved [Trypanosoma brucei gambiense DAL972]|uniref:Uncharacterized protein n=2 Tax=Trypanosoma brucei TaxID=5691 RepID=C9ZIM2_TRYB9|nr:hypothetical protein, conserved [Trypanosoma brucei gambiense DAL972]RHW74195.1 hypothetical protein DPX39_010031700 [Trypanosoma brucei equiperdum]CBH09014.1 hypothetical protein, conserved [Trypanosoma brucei gambiense DAL972]|eukprot:XP_011771455.1 hypothetical protein, conserved [Trypanosoma brucei gambiense DAL972]